MTEQAYCATLIARIFSNEELVDPARQDAIESVAAFAPRFYRGQWELADAVAFALCMEEVSPEIEESVALDKMAEVQAKYPKYSLQ
jgi:hypothetical protein